jgi:hypothetical protein
MQVNATVTIEAVTLVNGFAAAVENSPAVPG